MKIIVTGGAGFIGSNLVNVLINLGDQVHVIDNLLTGKPSNINPNAVFHNEDIRDFAKIKPLFTGVDYVFHTAAFPRVQPSIKDPILTNSINLVGTLNVLEASRLANVKKVVYSASSSAYGDQVVLPLKEDMTPNPMSPYGLQKYMGELYCKLYSDMYHLPTVCLRYFNVYGQGMNLEGAYTLVISIFINQRLNNSPMTVTGDGSNRRDYTNVKDVVRANILTAFSTTTGHGEVINIGRGHNYSTLEVANMIGGPITYIEPRIEPKETLADNTLAKTLLNWVPKVNLPTWIKQYKQEVGLDK